MPDTSGRLASAFPRPEETRPTGQPAFENDVLLVVPINLAFTNGIGRRDQSSRLVVGVGNDVLFGHPLERFRPLGALNLVVHGHDTARRVAQAQRAAYTVIQSFDAPQGIPENPQSVVIRVADRRQHAVAKVEET